MEKVFKLTESEIKELFELVRKERGYSTMEKLKAMFPDVFYKEFPKYYIKQPPTRVINETRQVSICKKCNSSMIRKYALFFWLKPFCINKECNTF